MPRPVLQWVAAILGLAAIGSFSLGIINAPQRGRLPGERLPATGAAPIQATDATPLSQERIEGPPPPPPLSPEEKAQLEADRKAKAEADAANKLAAANPAAIPPGKTDNGAIPPPKLGPPADRVGDLLDSVTPPPDDPPH